MQLDELFDDEPPPPGWVRTRYDEERGWLWRRATADEIAEAQALGIPVHLLHCDRSSK